MNHIVAIAFAVGVLHVCLIVFLSIWSTNCLSEMIVPLLGMRLEVRIGSIVESRHI
jgi:hypothetical protein